MSNFVNALESRRSQYALAGTSKLADREVVDLIERVAVQVPSAFNSQSQRAVVLFGQAHHRLWSIVLASLRKVVSDDEAFRRTVEKIAGFDAAHGTVLYFDDTAVTDDLAARFPLYADNFPVWAEQSNGMLQLAVWTALSEAGLGANVQHYNPLIDQAVHEEFALPQQWRLIAQMPFGDVVDPAGEKTVVPVEERVRVIGL